MNKRQAKKHKLLVAMCDDVGIIGFYKVSWRNLRRVNKDYVRFCNEYTWWADKKGTDICDIF